MKKLFPLLCFFTIAAVVNSSAQTLKIIVDSSKLLPVSCDSSSRVPLRLNVVYQGPSIGLPESIGMRYKISGATYKTVDSLTIDSLKSKDTVFVDDTILVNSSGGFVYNTEDIVVIWPTGSGGIAIVGDTIMDSTHVITTGIASATNSFNILLSPNPAANLLYLNYNEAAIRLEQVRICNMLGQPILVKNSSFNVIDITTLPDGFYLFEATTTDKKSYVTQFVKTHW